MNAKSLSWLLCTAVCIFGGMHILPSPILLSEALAAQDQGAKSTILSGKIMSTVTRAKVLPFDAIVSEALVQSGQEVQEGTVLMKYSLTEEAQRALDKEMLLGANTEETKAQILALQSQLTSLRAQSNTARQLASAGLGSNQASARSASEVRLLEQRITLLQQKLNKQEENFKRRLDELSDYYGAPITPNAPLPTQLELKAPMDGHVLSVAATVQPGAVLARGAAPILVGKMNPMRIQVQVFEGELARIKVGDSASVTIPSLNDKVFQAKVAQISWTSSDLDVAKASYFTVELTIPNPKLELKPGFKAIVQFGGK